jgi:hypothetical protein
LRAIGQLLADGPPNQGVMLVLYRRQVIGHFLFHGGGN